MTKVYKNKKDLINSVVSGDDTVLDVGFWGQAITRGDTNWVHALLKSRAAEVYGVDIVYDENSLDDLAFYKKQSAENFDFDVEFDVIFAGDLIEHLSNPGLFLDACARNIKNRGKLVLTTPNTFNLYSMVEKLFKDEPSVNPDHTFYFNRKVLRKLLEKNDWSLVSVYFLDDSEEKYKISIKRKIFRILYKAISLLTDKFTETIVIVAVKK